MEKIISILKNALGTEEINENTSKDNCELWDSFNHLVIIAELERELGIEFTIEQTEKMDSVKDIFEIVSKEI